MKEKLANLKTKWIEFQPKLKKWLKAFFFSFIWLGILMLVLDLVSKQLVVAFQDNIKNAPGGRIDLIPGFLAVNYTINTNVVFGLSFIENKAVTRILYIIIALILSGALVTYYVMKRKKLSKLSKACIMLILSGAIGNLIDRIFYTPEFLRSAENGVVDWIDFYGIWQYIFNWADSCLVVGCIMLLVYLIVTEILDYIKKNKNEPKVAPTKQLSKDEIAKLEREEAMNKKAETKLEDKKEESKEPTNE